MNTSALLVLLAVALATSGVAARRGVLQSDDTFDRCTERYQSAGGDSGVLALAPACGAEGGAAAFNFRACCSEVKSGLSGAGVEGCLCNQEVLSWIEGRVSDAGVQGLNSDTLGTFLRACGIANAKTGGC